MTETASVYEKSEEERRHIIEKVHDIAVMRSLDPRTLERVADSMLKTVVKKG